MDTIQNFAFLFCRASESITDTESGSESESISDDDGLDVPGKEDNRRERSEKTGNA